MSRRIRADNFVLLFSARGKTARVAAYDALIIALSHLVHPEQERAGQPDAVPRRFRLIQAEFIISVLPR